MLDGIQNEVLIYRSNSVTLGTLFYWISFNVLLLIPKINCRLFLVLFNLLWYFPRRHLEP